MASTILLGLPLRRRQAIAAAKSPYRPYYGRAPSCKETRLGHHESDIVSATHAVLFTWCRGPGARRQRRGRRKFSALDGHEYRREELSGCALSAGPRAHGRGDPWLLQRLAAQGLCANFHRGN